MTNRTAQRRRFILRLLECMYPRLTIEERRVLDDIKSNKIAGLNLGATDNETSDDDTDNGCLEAAETLMAWVEGRLTPLKALIIGTDSAISAQNIEDAMGSTLGQLVAEIVLCAGADTSTNTVNRAILDWAMDHNIILSWIDDIDLILDTVQGVIVIADDGPWPLSLKNIIAEAQKEGLMFHYTVLPTVDGPVAKKPTKSKTKK